MQKECGWCCVGPRPRAFQLVDNKPVGSQTTYDTNGQSDEQVLLSDLVTKGQP